MVDAPQSFGGYRPGNFDAAFNGPVSAATALRLSLNVPAVDLLDRVGSARFAARLSHAGINLRFPHGSAPNLSLILGGTGARLEDLVGSFAAFNRNGIAGRVRYRPDDAVIERRLMSPGAAWITREVLESNPRPGYGSGTFDVTGRPRVAWKTGTSYGYRDAWAIGSTRHYTVGVWVGRPDGTPLPGQYGAVTALPLMFEVVDSLPRQPGDASAAPLPGSVSSETICWPTGEREQDVSPALCQRRLEAYVLEGAVPPTFAERDARLWQAGRQRFQVDARSGLRLSPECTLPHEAQNREIARWPARVSPWLPLAMRRASQLPALSPDCREEGAADTGILHIEGLNDRATLARAPNAEHGVRLQLRALGTEQPVDWLLDDRWIARTEGARLLQRDFEDAGEHTLTALAADGAWTQVRFRILRLVGTVLSPHDQPGRCASTCSADDTSNLPGSSIHASRTTPLSTYSAKRRERTPIPEALASISSPSARVKSPLPSDSSCSPSGTCWVSPQAFITNGSFTAMQNTSMPRARNCSNCSTKPGRWRAEQVGVKAPGTPNNTALRPSNNARVSSVSMPSRMRLRVTSGIGSPMWMVMEVSSSTVRAGHIASLAHAYPRRMAPGHVSITARAPAPARIA